MPQCDHGRRPKRTRVGAEARRRSHGRYEPAAGRSRPIRFLFSWSVVRFTPSAGAALRQRAPTEANPGPSPTRRCSPGRHGAGQRRPLRFPFPWSVMRSPRSACAALPRRAPTDANSRSAPNPAAFPPGATSRPAPTPPLPPPVERDAFTPSAGAALPRRAPTEANPGPAPRPNRKPGGVPPGATSRPRGGADPSASSSRGAWWGSPRAPAPPASGSRRTGAAPAR